MESAPQRQMEQTSMEKNHPLLTSKLRHGSYGRSFNSCSVTSACSSSSIDISVKPFSGSNDAIQRPRTVSFDDNVTVIVVPRILFEEDLDSDDEEDDALTLNKEELVKREDLFYQQSEINLWLCEERMRKAGIDPETFDWRGTVR